MCPMLPAWSMPCEPRRADPRHHRPSLAWPSIPSGRTQGDRRPGRGRHRRPSAATPPRVICSCSRTRRATDSRSWPGRAMASALYLRRLERGTFAFPLATGVELAVTPTQLAMIPRWSRPEPRPPADPLHASGLSRKIQPPSPPLRVIDPTLRPTPSSEEHDRLRARTGSRQRPPAGDAVTGFAGSRRRPASPTPSRQQLTIDRLTRIAFGPSSERFAGPTHTGSALPMQLFCPRPRTGFFRGRTEGSR